MTFRLVLGRLSSRPSPIVGLSQRQRDRLFPYLLLTPAIVLVALYLVFPLFLLVNVSLRQLALGTITQIFKAPISVGNYLLVVTDPGTWHSFGVSLAYIAVGTAAAFAIGLGTALLLNERFVGRRLFRTLMLLPWAIPSVTATIGFFWMLNPSFGVVNYMLRSVGIIRADINWFGGSATALWAVTAPTVWKAYPFFTVMLLAALQSIPSDLYETAAVDGAGRFARFRWITWPGIQSYAVLAVIFNMMYLFREFDFIFASTQGGPAGATETTAIRIYNQAFQSFNLGTAAALGTLTFVLVSLVVISFMPRIIGKRA